jgi:predicted secreted hydrolase
VGWDWLGINLHDGSALTLFQLRRADGTRLWAGGSMRTAAGAVRNFAPEDVRMQAVRHWQSQASQSRYPVEWLLDCPTGHFQLRALFDTQEIDARRTSGLLYWEGVARLSDSAGRELGLGYLELTGYAGGLQLG